MGDLGGDVADVGDARGGARLVGAAVEVARVEGEQHGGAHEGQGRLAGLEEALDRRRRGELRVVELDLDLPAGEAAVGVDLLGPRHGAVDGALEEALGERRIDVGHDDHLDGVLGDPDLGGFERDALTGVVGGRFGRGRGVVAGIITGPVVGCGGGRGAVAGIGVVAVAAARRGQQAEGQDGGQPPEQDSLRHGPLHGTTADRSADADDSAGGPACAKRHIRRAGRLDRRSVGGAGTVGP